MLKYSQKVIYRNDLKKMKSEEKKNEMNMQCQIAEEKGY